MSVVPGNSINIKSDQIIEGMVPNPLPGVPSELGTFKIPSSEFPPELPEIPTAPGIPKLELQLWEPLTIGIDLEVPLPPLPKGKLVFESPTAVGIDLTITCPGYPACGIEDDPCSIGVRKAFDIPLPSLNLPFPPKIPKLPEFHWSYTIGPFAVPLNCPMYPYSEEDSVGEQA